MAHAYVLVVAGTVTAILSIILAVLHASPFSRRVALKLTRQWASASRPTTLLVLSPLAAIAIYCFASITDVVATSDVAAFAPPDPDTTNTEVIADGDARSKHAIASLRAYADKIDSKKQSITNLSAGSDETSNLPDVDTMIKKLEARLEKEPRDFGGWKTLGWSYLNTGKTQAAVRAYETALKLQPDDAEIHKALETAKSSGPSSISSAGAAAANIDAAEGQSVTDSADMVRGMVDRLATRLETSPNDEQGWVQLMRSRMTLGENEAAKTALTKALETFASDAAARDRLTASARELGVENN